MSIYQHIDNHTNLQIHLQLFWSVKVKLEGIDLQLDLDLPEPPDELCVLSLVLLKPDNACLEIRRPFGCHFAKTRQFVFEQLHFLLDPVGTGCRGAP